MSSRPRIIPAAITPFDNKLNIDFDLYLHHLQTLFEEGAEGVLIFGTTGEANSIALQERMELFKFLSSAPIEKEKIFVGTGCSNYVDTINLSNYAVDSGFNNLLVLPPFYFKNITDAGLINYFDLVLRNLRKSAKVYLYHFPVMSAIEFSQNVISALREKYPENVMGMKDSTGNWENTFSIVNNNKNFEVYVGNEKAFLRCLNKGCAGIISATFNLQIGLAKKILDAFELRTDEMFELEAKMVRNRKKIEGLPIIPVVKYFLAKKYKNDAFANIRPPLVALNNYRKRIADELYSEIFSD